MSSAAVLRAQTVSRMAMSPSHDKNDELMSILQSAKEDLKKEKKMKVKWDKVFKNGPNKIFGRQPLKNLKDMKQTIYEADHIPSNS